MSYKAELEERDRQARTRMGLGVSAPVGPKELLAATQPVGGVAAGTGVCPPLIRMPEPEYEPKVVLVRSRESQERRMAQVTSSANKSRLEEEASALPRLKPLVACRRDGPFNSWRQMLAAVAQHYGLNIADILGVRRSRHVVQARFECMYRMRSELCMSFPNIAEKMGRDHSTVIHGVNTIHRRLLDAERAQMQSGAALAHGMMPKRDASSLKLVAA